ncbi:hypothetical protein BH10BDE1_BH10BDE1_15220 [soil metagenome]
MNRIIMGFWLAVAALAVFANPAPSQANTKASLPTESDSARVFQCLISSGEFQNITVYSMSDGTLRLTTLNNAGSQNAYQLPYAQWSSGRLSIPCSHDEKKSCGHVFANGRVWEYDFGGDIGNCG